MTDVSIYDVPPPNPDLIQDQGRIRLELLLVNENLNLLSLPPIDTVDIPPPTAP